MSKSHIINNNLQPVNKYIPYPFSSTQDLSIVRLNETEHSHTGDMINTR